MEKTRWYSEGIKFGCTECGGCCGGAPGYVWVAEEEIAAMAKEMGLPKFEFENIFVRLIHGRKKSLMERSNGDCALLDPESRRCLVYNSRPTQCRTWPFWEQNLASPSAWKKNTKTCKGCANPQGKLYNLEEIEKEREKTF